MNNLSNEMLQKAKECKTLEELLNLAKENDFPLTEEQATEKFNEWNKTGELADEELENVAGGGCDCGLHHNEVEIGQNVGLWKPSSGTEYCETCKSERYIVEKIEGEIIFIRCANGCANMVDGSSIRNTSGLWITY